MAGVPVALIIFDMNLLLNHNSNYVYRVLVCFAEHINTHTNTATITKNRPSNCIPNIKSGQNADFIFPCGCYSCYKEHNCTHNLNALNGYMKACRHFEHNQAFCVFRCVCVCHFVLFIRGTPKGKMKNESSGVRKHISCVQTNQAPRQHGQKLESKGKREKSSKRKCGATNALYRI